MKPSYRFWRFILWIMLSSISSVGCAPIVEYRLEQTIKSLPSAPADAILLAQQSSPAGGTDCVAYAVQRLYGSQRPFEAAVKYYSEALLAQGWRELSPTLQLGELMRGDDEHFGIFSEDDYIMRNAIETAENLSAEELERFSTLYLVRVARSCGGGATELWQHIMRPPATTGHR